MTPIRYCLKCRTLASILLVLGSYPIGALEPPSAPQTAASPKTIATPERTEWAAWTEKGLLWGETVGKDALFIPETLLNSSPLNELPLRDSDREALDQALRSESPAPRMIFGKMTPDCAMTDVHTGIGDPTPEARHLLEILKVTRVVFIGRVVNVNIGWNAGYRHVSSMVEMRIEEVIRAYRDWPRAGQSVFYEQLHGEFYVGDHRLCNLTVSGRDSFRAVKGQRVLVTGIDHDLNPKLVLGAMAWPVSSRGDVVPQAYEAILPELVSLTVLRRALTEKGDS